VFIRISYNSPAVPKTIQPVEKGDDFGWMRPMCGSR
jgi:hypothetical protein